MSPNVKSIEDLLKLGPGPNTIQHTCDRHLAITVGDRTWPWDREHLHQARAHDDDQPLVLLDGHHKEYRLTGLRLLAWWSEHGRCADLWCDLCEPFRSPHGIWNLEQTTGFVNTIWFAPPRTPNERSHIYQAWICASSMQALFVEIRRKHEHAADLLVTVEPQYRLVNDIDGARTKVILAVTKLAEAPPSVAVAKYNALLQALEPSGWVVASPRVASAPAL